MGSGTTREDFTFLFCFFSPVIKKYGLIPQPKGQLVAQHNGAELIRIRGSTE